MSKEVVVQGKNELKVHSTDRRSDIEFVQDKFRISDAVNQLHDMMKEVTKTEINAKNVNAACHCIHQLNETINTTITAARFLREK
jgi:predicted RNA methylase